MLFLLQQSSGRRQRGIVMDIRVCLILHYPVLSTRRAGGCLEGWVSVTSGLGCTQGLLTVM